MTKEEWRGLYNILDQVYSDFTFAYSDMTNGSNQKIRREGERKVNNAMRLAFMWIERYEEVYILATGGENVSNTSRAYIYDDFSKHRYFGRELSGLLRKIDEMIKLAE